MEENSRKTAPSYDSHPVDVMALARLFVVGLLSGIVGWILYLGIAEYFIEPVFCQSAQTFAICRNGGSIAWVSATVVVLAASVAALAQLAVYRPLLVVLAAFAALWSAHSWLGGLSWYGALLWQGLLFAVAFAVFGWIARTTNFVVAVVASLAVAVLARIVLMLS